MRILIIEDEKEITDFLKVSLESESFSIDMADDGERGSYLARTNDYDLIILDNNLPKKEGLQVCEEIRTAGKTVPIIILSVDLKTSTKINLLNAGVDDYLTKPFSLEELLARIRALMRRPKQIEEEVMILNDFIIDTKRHTVERSGKSIYLTRKEFMLVEYLMRNKGIVVSRGMIMEHVWDMNADPFSNTIESHILSIRRKIGNGGKNKRKLIHTIPGIGYKIDLL